MEGYYKDSWVPFFCKGPQGFRIGFGGNLRLVRGLGFRESPVEVLLGFASSGFQCFRAPGY